ncbi:MAG: tetratricopeptide repeat protein, partial [Chloroflexi bacterium]|nr:tetratricopeptide repeat protein [Chloroflexota bacterium]
MNAQIPREITEAVVAFLDAETRGEKKQIVTIHFDKLLSAAANQVFDMLQRHWEDDEASVRHLQEHRALLAQCQELGIEAAFAAYLKAQPDSVMSQQELTDLLWQLTFAPTWMQAKQLVESNPILLSSSVDAMLTAMIETRVPFAPLVVENCQVLARCRVEGIEAAFADLVRLNEQIEAFTVAKSWGDLRECLQTYPTLLTEEAIRQLEGFIQRAQHREDQSMAQLLTERRDLLRRCLDEGIGVLTELELESILPNLRQPAHLGDESRRVELCRHALMLISREDNASLWGEVQILMGNNLLEIPGQHRARNIEEAIAAYRQALEVFPCEAMPIEWAIAMHGLANAFCIRIDGNRAENIEQAIDFHKQSLGVWEQQDQESNMAESLGDLATAYMNRIRGEPAENIEQAINAYQKSFKLTARESAPDRWARCLYNLGNTYLGRIRGKPAENIDLAIAAYKQSLDVRTREHDPVAWARTKNVLGMAYTNRIRGDPVENQILAIDTLQQALEVRTQQNRPFEWAATMHNLGRAYTECANLSADVREECLRRAIETYQQVLKVWTFENCPVSWAKTMYSLAQAYEKQAQIDGVRVPDQAIAAYQQALRVFTLVEQPQEHQATQRALGDLYFSKCCWAEAIIAYTAALEAVKRSWKIAATPQGRQWGLLKYSCIADNSAYCLAKANRHADAVVILEQNKARALTEALARSEALLATASASDQAAFAAARERIAILEAQARATSKTSVFDQLGQRLAQYLGLPVEAINLRVTSFGKQGLDENAEDFTALSTNLRQAREELATIADRIRTYVPDFMPAELDFPDIASLVSDLNQPLVYLVTTSHGSLALLVAPLSQEEGPETASVHPVWLDGFNTEALGDFLYDQEGTPRYLRGTVLADGEVLEAILDEIWPVLDRQLMAPLATRLQELGYGQAVLVPCGRLSLLPLHAVVLDRVTLTHTPSARALQAVVYDEDHVNMPPALLGIGNPTSRGQQPLVSAQLEVAEIAALFAESGYGSATFCEATAVRKDIVIALPGTTYLHFSCHGRFDMDNPLNSALYLAEDDTLTLRDLLDGDLDISAARLAVL